MRKLLLFVVFLGVSCFGLANDFVLPNTATEGEAMMQEWQNKLLMTKNEAERRRLRFETELIYEKTLFLSKQEYERNKGRKSIDRRAEELLGSEIPYSPDRLGVDRSVTTFFGRDLAEDYIKAVKERYEVTNLTVVADIGTYVEGFPLNDARGLFNEKSVAARGERTFYQTYVHLIPDMGHEQKMAIKKMQTFSQVEGFKSELAQALMQALMNGSIDGDERRVLDEITAKLEGVIKDFPGNDDSDRRNFLNKLGSQGENHQELNSTIEELRYQTEYAEAIGNKNPMGAKKARLFFFMLGNYFNDVFHKEYVLWTKVMPERSTYGQSIRNSVEVRFYISKTQEFIKNVFHEEIPINIVKAWGALKDSREEERIWALQMVDIFLSRNRQYFSALAGKRLFEAFRYVTSVSVAQSLVGSDWKSQVLKKNCCFRPKFKTILQVDLENGEKMTQDNALQLRALDRPLSGRIPVGVLGVYTDFGGLKTTVKVDPEKKTLITKNKYISETRSIEKNPYRPYDFRSGETFNISHQMKLAIQSELPIVTSLLLESEEEFW